MERWIVVHRRLLAGVSAGLLAFVPLLWLYEDRIGPLPGEPRVASHLYRRPTNALVESLTDFVVSLGDPGVVLLTLLLGMVLSRRALGLRAALLVPAAAFVAVLARGIKSVLGPTPFYSDLHLRVRLPKELQDALLPGNLPSGHTAYVTSVFGLFAAYALMRGRRALALLLLVPIPAMGVALNLGGQHVPSDVLGGLALGAAWLILLLLWLTRRR